MTFAVGVVIAWMAIVVFGTLALQALIVAARLVVWLVAATAFLILLPFAAIEAVARAGR